MTLFDDDMTDGWYWSAGMTAALKPTRYDADGYGAGSSDIRSTVGRHLTTRQTTGWM
ncbi:MAG: hypothetical protein R2856_08530 [Caldilineaceae bacterium]